MKTKIKKAYKLAAAVLAVCVLSPTAFVACKPADTNEAPEILGAGDFNCIINEPIDLLSKVVALDKEDGDLTPQLKITASPEVEINDGVVVFPTEDEYTITYSVTDSDGNTTTAEAYASVYSRAVYNSFDLVDLDGFSVDVAGGAKLETQSVTG